MWRKGSAEDFAYSIVTGRWE